MALPSSGNLSLSQVYAEFSAPANTPLSAFLRGGVYVPDTPTNINVPTGLPISLRQLLGASAVEPLSVTIAGNTNQNCNYASPNTSCISSSVQDANPVGGVPPYTYQWTVVSGNGVSFTAPTSEATQVTRSASVSQAIVVRCTVTDSMLSTAFADKSINTNHINTGS